MREALPVPEFPPELLITERIDEIVELLKTHRVIVVAGETGLGKPPNCRRRALRPVSA